MNNSIHFDMAAAEELSENTEQVDSFLQLKSQRNSGNANGLRLHHQSLHKDEREICGNKRVVNTLQKGTRAEEKKEHRHTHSQKMDE